MKGKKKQKLVFRLEVRYSGLLEILCRVTDGKPEPTLFKFRNPDCDGSEFRKEFEALKEGDFIFLRFQRKRRTRKK